MEVARTRRDQHGRRVVRARHARPGRAQHAPAAARDVQLPHVVADPAFERAAWVSNRVGRCAASPRPNPGTRNRVARFPLRLASRPGQLETGVPVPRRNGAHIVYALYMVTPIDSDSLRFGTVPRILIYPAHRGSVERHQAAWRPKGPKEPLPGQLIRVPRQRDHDHEWPLGKIVNH